MYGLIHMYLMSKTPDVSTNIELSSISGEVGKEEEREVFFQRGRTMGQSRSRERQLGIRKRKQSSLSQSVCSLYAMQ